MFLLFPFVSAYHTSCNDHIDVSQKFIIALKLDLLGWSAKYYEFKKKLVRWQARRGCCKPEDLQFYENFRFSSRFCSLKLKSCLDFDASGEPSEHQRPVSPHGHHSLWHAPKQNNSKVKNSINKIMQTHINKHIERGFKTEINSDNDGEDADSFPY